MTRQERNKRRTLIIRRWTAYRVSRAQREIWKRRRAHTDATIDETVGTADADLLAELPDGLLG